MSYPVTQIYQIGIFILCFLAGSIVYAYIRKVDFGKLFESFTKDKL